MFGKKPENVEEDQGTSYSSDVPEKKKGGKKSNKKDKSISKYSGSHAVSFEVKYDMPKDVEVEQCLSVSRKGHFGTGVFFFLNLINYCDRFTVAVISGLLLLVVGIVIVILSRPPNHGMSHAWTFSSEDIIHSAD